MLSVVNTYRNVIILAVIICILIKLIVNYLINDPQCVFTQVNIEVNVIDWIRFHIKKNRLKEMSIFLALDEK